MPRSPSSFQETLHEGLIRLTPALQIFKNKQENNHQLISTLSDLTPSSGSAHAVSRNHNLTIKSFHRQKYPIMVAIFSRQSTTLGFIIALYSTRVEAGSKRSVSKISLLMKSFDLVESGR